MKETFAIRHYVPDQDVSALSRLLTEIESVDQEGEETSEEYLRSMMTWPNYDPGRNSWVVELGGALTGYGQTHPTGDDYCSIYVGCIRRTAEKGWEAGSWRLFPPVLGRQGPKLCLPMQTEKTMPLTVSWNITGLP
jgi:hypothetical protein